MKKLVVAIAWLALASAPLAFAQKKTLVVGMGSADAGKLDPHIASTTPDKGLLSWMFNGLVRIRPGKISPEFIEPDLAEMTPQAGDVFMLCSDGLTTHVGDAEIASHLGDGVDLDGAAVRLVEAANRAGGLDNVTVLLVGVDGEG